MRSLSWRWRRQLSTIAQLILLSSCSPPLLAASDLPAGVSEYALKAVLLLKLPRFVYWPAQQERTPPWSICILGDNPFEQTLSRLTAANSNDDEFSITELITLDPDVTCDLLFISRNKERQLETVLAQLNKYPPTVTISDIKDFARRGGMIELALATDTAQRSLEIVINRDTATRHQLDFNAQLLRLATLIKP